MKENSEKDEEDREHDTFYPLTRFHIKIMTLGNLVSQDCNLSDKELIRSFYTNKKSATNRFNRKKGQDGGVHPLYVYRDDFTDFFPSNPVLS